MSVTKAYMPKAEAIVQIKAQEGWIPSVSFDPIDIPVDVMTHNGIPLSADVYHSPLIWLVNALTEIETPDAEYRLVWSVDGNVVRGLCPVCDDMFVVSDGFGGDQVNAVSCGCEED